MNVGEVPLEKLLQLTPPALSKSHSSQYAVPTVRIITNQHQQTKQIANLRDYLTIRLYNDLLYTTCPQKPVSYDYFYELFDHLFNAAETSSHCKLTCQNVGYYFNSQNRISSTTCVSQANTTPTAGNLNSMVEILPNILTQMPPNQ